LHGYVPGLVVKIVIGIGAREFVFKANLTLPEGAGDGIEAFVECGAGIRVVYIAAAVRVALAIHGDCTADGSIDCGFWRRVVDGAAGGEEGAAAGLESSRDVVDWR